MKDRDAYMTKKATYNNEAAHIAQEFNSDDLIVDDLKKEEGKDE
jgi:hypothetical protein